MQAQTSFVNFNKSNEINDTHGLGIGITVAALTKEPARSIKITLLIKVTPFFTAINSMYIYIYLKNSNFSFSQFTLPFIYCNLDGWLMLIDGWMDSLMT